jgi:hypothetical protein
MEIVHRTKQKQKEMAALRGQKSDSIDQDPCELFCMAYAQHYSGSGLIKYDNPVWDQFIRNLGDQ